ncbi:hypothetical protein MPNT_120059 [Candidatus Methylacidithermus pantelleriae]|uniref:Uncharacterized protein n=1 Tax=Candidatus Methylacidithermus pantelleriae TaxID=2744239 RepID=A0A8J2BI80_9BACT|nr:hypothetical protein MPNT_120059 [Candidatus Methylacidithermus pantelleriae]
MGPFRHQVEVAELSRHEGEPKAKADWFVADFLWK